ncbi:T9SS type A sorting domain-containing protein [Tamlana fucoidanivorans]|uniref:T9SS type A sorting domain-containing protein n=1 Tax=Allotamlana fucoidanivorans TaxID=2583814 RepID=A0A5C4SLR1_9FLAO|nr:T9SS type A sorting domain-containing protein [Tamlana fucoidanivorans]TNJ44977.1 T9SS type A sorting domain-containing protein [Tamlana fucoidanivorans]
MKKITLKISAFLMLTMFALQVQGQIVSGQLVYIKNVATGEYLKGPNTDTYEMGVYTGGDDFKFYLVESGSYWNIDSENRGIMRGVGSTRTTVHTTKAPPAGDVDKVWTAVSLGSDTYQFYLRDNGAMLMQWNSSDGALKLLKDDAGTDTSAHWVLETSEPVLSNEKFDTSSIFISNPVNNILDIKGLTASVNKVSVYSLLGNVVLTQSLQGESAISLNVSGLASGMYIVKLQGENGSFSKKIVKQ